MCRGKVKKAVETGAGVQEGIRTKDMNWESPLQSRKLELSKGWREGNRS